MGLERRVNVDIALDVLHYHPVAVQKREIRRILSTFEALSDLGPALTAECQFSETAPRLLSSLLDAIDAREGAILRFNDKPALLSSIAVKGFLSFPEPAVLPLLPRHVIALSRLPGPIVLDDDRDTYLSANGNFAPQLIKCISPLRVGPKLVGVVALGQHDEDATYSPEELDIVGLLSHYIALGLHNHSLSETLTQKITENLKLVTTLHSFYDTTLEAFASAIDYKQAYDHNHSMAVARYAAGIAEALGMDNTSVAGIRAAGYLHDVGKVAINAQLLAKPDKLSEQEFREVADHTVLGHNIVSGIQFPWPEVPSIVRGHHERSDGSGYPDCLRHDEVSSAVHIMAVADSFDAMTSDRPFRKSFSVGEALTKIVQLTPTKFDAAAVQALLIQTRRDSVAAMKLPNPVSSGFVSALQDGRKRFLDEGLTTIAPHDIDQIAATLNHKLTHGREYSS